MQGTFSKLGVKGTIGYMIRANLSTKIHNLDLYWESVAGFVIQATGTMEFEDGLWIGKYLQARNGPQRVRTIPGVLPGVVCTPRFLYKHTEIQWLLADAVL